MRHTLFLALFLALPVWAEPPLNQFPQVVGREPYTITKQMNLGPVAVVPGRFIPITPPEAVPSYLADSPAYRIYRVPAGTLFVGVQYDAAANAEPQAYSWEAKTVYVLLARSAPGTYELQFLKNGPADTGPVVNGNPLTIEIGGPRPPPGPGPTPPEPPSPTVGKLRVAFFYDSNNRILPPEQQTIRTSQIVRDYLKTHALAGPDGKTPEVRFIDIPADMSGESEVWKAMEAEPRASLPWISVGNGKTGWKGPLPANVADTLELLKKFGGQ